MGSGKKQKVGNAYDYGVHGIPCRKADAILAIRMADKVIWEGDQGDGFIDIHDLDAFGGDEREGGFSGRIAVMLGGIAQTANGYLESIFGTLTPAFRGRVSLVFERPYFNANSARLPSISTKQVNIEDIHKGWLPEKCVVDAEGYLSTAAIYIAMDVSLSMAGDKLATQGAALAAFVRRLKGKSNSIRVVAYSATINASIERLDCDDDDYEDIAVWIEDYTTLVTGGDWNAAVGQAETFYDVDDGVARRISDSLVIPTFTGLTGGQVTQRKRRIIIFTTDGAPVAGTPELAAATIAAIGGVEVFAFNIADSDTTETEKIDNTPRDAVPVVSGTDPGELGVALGQAFRSWVDLNPAHLQRCLLIDPMRGGTATEAEIGDSFAVAADLYLAEGFGLSVVFTGDNAKDRMEIDRHCDAVTWKSRKTGKWEHAAIRDDFDFEDLPVLDGTVVKDWSKLRRPKARELPNRLTVLYTDRTNGKTASITREDPVAVMEAGRVRPAADANYPFITIPSLAARVAVRDVGAAGATLLAGDVPLAYLPADFELSSIVRLRVPKPDGTTEDIAVRITEVRHEGGNNAEVWLKVVEHRFELGAPVDLPDTPPVTIDDRARPATIRMIEEAPYYISVIAAGQDAVDDQLAAEPGLGRLIAAAARPNARHLDATVAVDDGGGWTDDGTISFSPVAETTEAMTSEATDTTVRVALTADLAQVTEGQLARIDAEIIRIDAAVEDGAEVILTIGRACLDTAPRAHASGATILFFGPGEVIEADYLDSDVVDVKLLTNTATAKLALSKAPTDTVTFDSRAIRPYPPGQFKLNGSYVQDQVTDDVVLTWVGRDRTTQTTLVPEDHDDAAIGPEAGVTYRVVAEALNSGGSVISTVTDTNVGTATTHDWDDATVLPSGTVRVRFSVVSVRGGYESWQRPEIDMAILLPPGSLTVEEV